jgi:oxygen-dependent protoporphyrinogen oxidase
MPNSRRVVIVGAGISGLATAYRLQQLDPAADISVLEQRDRPGGTIWTERRDGFQVELGANGFLDSKPATLELCRAAGLGDRLVAASEGASRNRYLFWEGRLRRLPAGFGDFLRSDLMSWRGKVRLLLERVRRRRPDGRDESVEEFARRRGGEEAVLFADALVTGIHAGDPGLLSIRAAFPRVAALEAEHGGVLKGLAAVARERRAAARARGEPARRGSTMWSFREGLRLLIESLRDRLARPPLLGAAARGIEATPDASTRWLIRGEGQDAWPADAVLLACPAYRQAALLHDLDPELADRINGIAYNRVAVVALGYRQADIPMSLDGFGYIAPQRTRRDVLGVQWCSSIFPARAPGGAVLLRAMAGGWQRPEVAGWENERLLEAVRAELKAAMGVLAEPVFHSITRWDRAIPQYHLGHVERVAWIEERVRRHPGLFVGGNAYHGVAMNDCTERGSALAEAVQRYLVGGRGVGW